jgi:hypothetical protein
MTKYDPIPTSEKLTDLLLKKQNLKPRAEQSRATVWHLTKIVAPQINDATVSIVLDDDSPMAARIGLKRSSDPKKVVSTGIDEQDEAARKKEALERTIRGEPLADSISIKEKLENEHRQWAAIEEAIEFCDREIKKEKTVLAIQYSKQLKETHNDLVKKVCKPMLELHAAWTELNNLKRHLIDNEIGLHGLCLTMPDFLSTPNNPHSEMADFLRAAKREGYIKEIPVEYRV